MRAAAPMLRVLERCGLTIKRGGYDIDELKTLDQTHLIWGMSHPVEIYEELAQLNNVFFMENGWFTQSTGCYIDRQGANAMSSICGTLEDEPLTENVASDVFQFMDDLHLAVNVRPPRDESGYLFVPLQVEKDTQLLYWSGCQAEYPNRQIWFIDQVCEAFPDMKIIIRPHPRDRDITERIKKDCHGFKTHPNIYIRSDRSSYDWIAGARGVVGINSTVLLEGLSLCKPVCAMGYGLFSDNGVVYECRGEPDLLRGFLEYHPDRVRRTRFIHLLMSRQIPYRLKDSQVEKYPILTELLEYAGVHVDCRVIQV